MDAAAADARRIATSVRDERTRFNHDLACTCTRGIVRIAKADAGRAIASVRLNGRAIDNQRSPFVDGANTNGAVIAACVAEEPSSALERERAGLRKRPGDAARPDFVSAIDIDRARRIRRHFPIARGIDAAKSRLDVAARDDLVRGRRRGADDRERTGRIQRHVFLHEINKLNRIRRHGHARRLLETDARREQRGDVGVHGQPKPGQLAFGSA